MSIKNVKFKYIIKVYNLDCLEDADHEYIIYIAQIQIMSEDIKEIKFLFLAGKYKPNQCKIKYFLQTQLKIS